MEGAHINRLGFCNATSEWVATAFLIDGCETVWMKDERRFQLYRLGFCNLDSTSAMDGVGILHF